jgi:regulator of sirC expression with transglutaminase-like and TPR domain
MTRDDFFSSKQATHRDSNEAWMQMARSDPQSFDLLGACLLLALDEYPGLEALGVLQSFKAMQARANNEIDAQAEFLERLAALVKFIHATENFQGNSLDYDNPQNTYLNDLLDRKLGIPISLALIYIELGKCFDIEFQPVGFPGHFLISVSIGSGVLVLDPFYFGKALSFDELKHRLNAVTDESDIDALDDEAVFDAIRPCSERQMFIRMLLNLRAIYRQNNDEARYLRVLNRLVLLTDHAELLRERAQHCFEIGAMNSAIADLEAYLARAPSKSDEEAVQQLLVQAKLSKTVLN